MNSQKGRDPGGPWFGGLFGLLDLPFIEVLTRWPAFLVRFERLRMLQMLHSARGPALTMIWTNLFWIIPILVFNQYAQVYAIELGLKLEQIGYLSAVTMCFSVVFYLVGGWLTDRLGSLRCVLLFDTLSWPLQMAILAAADAPWHFYAAAALAGTMTGVVPGWHAIFVSRVVPDRRAAAYGLLAIISNLPGLIFPLAGGWLVGEFGMELGMRLAYLAAAWLMLLGCALRWMLIPPTPPSQERLTDAYAALVEQFSIYFRTALRADLRWFFLALVLMNLDLAITGVFLPVYFMKYLGLPEKDYSLVTTVACLVRLVGMAALVPLIRAGNIKRFLLGTATCWALGTAILLALLRTPKPPAVLGALVPEIAGAWQQHYLLVMIMLVSTIWAVGGALWGPAIMAQWMNVIPEDIRSRLWGAHGAVGQLLAAGALAAVPHICRPWPPSLIVVELSLEAGAVVCFWLSLKWIARADGPPRVSG